MEFKLKFWDQAAPELAAPPRLCVTIGKRHFTGAGVNAGNFGVASAVEAIFDNCAVGKRDLVVLVGNVFAELIN
jgi:hypothetical protein